jgi:hypothetical protein
MQTSVVKTVAAFAERVRTAHPVYILAPLGALQVGLTAWFATQTAHNGWVWYSGGDATEYWMEQWALGHLFFPRATVGWALPVFYAWMSHLAGPSLAQGLAVVVVLQAGVLLTLALVFFWGIADLLYGRLFAAWASLLWVLAPVLLVFGFRQHRFRESFENYFLAPHWYGLTNMADFPSVVAVLGCAYLTLRACANHRWSDAVMGGLVGGLLIGIKPANAYFLPAVAIPLLATRRPYVIAAWTAALVPGLAILFVWKERGLGHVPLTAFDSHRLAAPYHPAPAHHSLRRYFPWDPHHLGQQLIFMREYFWSVRFLEYLAVAGALGALRRRPVRGLFLVVWVGAFLILKGSNSTAEINTTSYFRITQPGIAGLVLLVASIVFLAPRLGRRDRIERDPPRAVGPRAVAATVVVTVIAPLALLYSAHPTTPPHWRFARYNEHATEAIVTDDLRARAQSSGGHVQLTWGPVSVAPSKAQYILFKATQGTDGCYRPQAGAPECFLSVIPLTITNGNQATVPKGNDIYRIGLASNFANEPNGADLMLLGPPVTVRG